MPDVALESVSGWYSPPDKTGRAIPLWTFPRLFLVLQRSFRIWIAAAGSSQGVIVGGSRVAGPQIAQEAQGVVDP